MVIHMKEILKSIMQAEIMVLKNLLSALDEQHKYIAGNELIKLASIVEAIEKCNKDIAKIEVDRRKVTKGESMKMLIEECKDQELELSFRNINKLLQEIKLQKDTNEVLLKKGLSFSAQMLNLLKPDRSAKTYNAYGRSK